MKFSSYYWAVLAVLAAAASSAHGAIIYGTDSPSLGGGLYPSDYDSDPVSQLLADSFVLQEGMATITGIHWWGQLIDATGNESHDFTISIFEDDNGAPAQNAYWSSYVGAVVQFSGTEYWVDIAPLSLAANSTYYLSIVNNIPGSASWVWEDSTDNFGFWFREDETANWSIADPGDFYGLAFYLTGPDSVIPEPATMTLLGLGLALLAFRYRQRRGNIDTPR